MVFSGVLPTVRHGVAHSSMGCTSTQNDTDDSTPGCKSTCRNAMERGSANSNVIGAVVGLPQAFCGDGCAAVALLQGRAGARP